MVGSISWLREISAHRSDHEEKRRLTDQESNWLDLISTFVTHVIECWVKVAVSSMLIFRSLGVTALEQIVSLQELGFSESDALLIGFLPGERTALGHMSL